MRKFLDLVNECDVFPYQDKDAQAYEALTSSLYTLVWLSDSRRTPIGFVRDHVVEQILRVPFAIIGKVDLDRTRREISLFQLPTYEQRNRQAAALASHWREQKTFQVLSGWRDELYPVYGPNNELLYSIERTASALLGIVTYGVHMTGYTKSEGSSHGIKIWIPRRARGKQTYGGMLDNTVAGGKATGEETLECLVRECEEEASLDNQLVRHNATAAGSITYLYLRSEQATGEVGLIQPECEHVFDLELPSGVVPRPNDSEVEQFYLWTVEEVQEHMLKGEFKPNCALVMLDFFIRHGILTRENEGDLQEIQARIHRHLEFPGPHRDQTS